MPKFNEFIKNFGEQEQAQPKKKYGGIAGYLQDAGFEPYEINEKEDYLKVKNNEGKDFEIRNSGKGKYNYNVFEDGKQTYQYVPYHAFFEDIVAGKSPKDLEKYRFKEEPKAEAPKAPEAPKPTGTQKFSELKDYVGKLSDDEKEMLLDLLNFPRKK